MDQIYQISFKFCPPLLLPPPPLPPSQGPALLNLTGHKISVQVEITSWQKLLRPKSPADENSSSLSLWKMFLFFLPLPLPSPSNKAGWAFTVNCLGIIYNNIIILRIFLSICWESAPRAWSPVQKYWIDVESLHQSGSKILHLTTSNRYLMFIDLTIFGLAGFAHPVRCWLSLCCRPLQ